MTAILYCDKMETDITDFMKACTTYQRFKKNKKTHDKLPPDEVTMTIWETVGIHVHTQPLIGQAMTEF